MLTVLATPQVAEAMVANLSKKTGRKLAYEWMGRHPVWATQAWCPILVGRTNVSQKAVHRALLGLRQTRPEAVAEGLQAYPEEAFALANQLLSIDPALVLPKRVERPTFWAHQSLPPIILRDEVGTLPSDAVEVVGICLSLCDDLPYAGLATVKQITEPDSLAAFGWALFQQWLEAGGPTKESWALSSLAYIGNDDVARDLATLIRKWPGESQHKRAILGLDVLLGFGTEAALMHLDAIARKVKFKGIKHAAQERIEQVALGLGLSKDELADRLVPRLGLDEAGFATIDYGPRQFTVTFDEALQPIVRDQEGKTIWTLPKPGAKDDATLAGPGENRFKQLKKDTRALAELQVQRFEVAMITGRRWPQGDFIPYLVDHPLLVHLVRRLIWGTYDEGNRLVATFRVAEDGTFANQDDQAIDLPMGWVGIAHPVEMESATMAAWTEVLQDYELLQPFDQLSRPVFTLPEGDKAQEILQQNPKQKVPVGRLLGLTNRGWERGEGVVCYHFSRPLPDGGHELRLNLEKGIPVGGRDGFDTIKNVTICHRDDWSGRPAMRFGSLSPALLSELLATINDLQAPV